MAILLNGTPGPWIQCKNGLRQGDPLSPFLFIIIADVLQRMIIKACEQNLLAHPISPGLSCPVLQYADDTLIIIRADTSAAANLKRILDDFSNATRLTINFSKPLLPP